MTFEEYWSEVEKLKALPNTAIIQIPLALSAETKKKLMKMRPEETESLITTVIDQINHGSVERVDDLVRKQL